MAATINTNIASINAQRNLALSGQSLTTTMQRLSSGLRVNSAKDDAAGLAIAERMNTQVKGLTVASRNANDGISLAQTAEGALGKVGDMLQRMRELAVQAANATNSASDRVALQAEVSQLAAEVDRVAKQTNFNGQKILDGSFAGAVFQVGANSGDNVTLGALADVRTSQLSAINFATNSLLVSVNDNPNVAIEKHTSKIPAGELKIHIGDSPVQTISLEEINPANSSLERLGQVVTAINNKAVDTGLSAYMSYDAVEDKYTIQLMSSKTDAEGAPLRVNFEGFKQEITGIGGSFEVAEKTFPTLASGDVPRASGATSHLSGTTITSENLKAEIEKWETFVTNLKEIEETVQPSPSLQGRINSLDSALQLAKSGLTVSGGLDNTTTTPTVSGLRNTFHAALSGTTTPSGSPSLITAATFNTTGTTINASILGHNETMERLKGATPSTIANQLTADSTIEDFNNSISDMKKLGFDTSADFDLSNYASGMPATWIDEESAENAAAALRDLVYKETTGNLNFTTEANNTNVRGLDTIDVTTQSGAWIALKKIDSAIDQINASRATLGAMQTRFETAVNNIDIQVENLSAAKGRIVDADFAVETANLSRTQILQQAGTAMVAQANQIPQSVLQLLQG